MHRLTLVILELTLKRDALDCQHEPLYGTLARSSLNGPITLYCRTLLHSPDLSFPC